MTKRTIKTLDAVEQYLDRCFTEAKELNDYCEQNIPNWQNDAFSMGPLRFIWGLTQEDAIPSFETDNFIQIYYSFNTNKYYLDVIIDPSDMQTRARLYTEYCQELYKYIIEETGNTDDSIGKRLQQLYTLDATTLTEADSILDLYCQLKIFVAGLNEVYK